jgi:endonuclease YncB( thermonuclease family)
VGQKTFVRARSRPFYRSVLDGLVFLVVLAAAMALIQRFGGFDLGEGAIHVIDGDSLRMGETEIRLQGIDAPEYRQTCRDKHGVEFPCGKHAPNVLRGLIGSGKIACRSHEIDRYGRSVATCANGGLELNAEMLRMGWAVAYGDSPAYLRLQAEAKRAKRGLWAGPFEMPEAYRARMRKLLGGAGGIDGAAGQD